MQGALSRSFFYLVNEDPPPIKEFLSYDAKGLTPPNASPQTRHLYEGVSMFLTEEQARSLARELTGKDWNYIAEVSIPEEVLIERQGRREGHHLIFAAPADLKSWVVRVRSVR